MSGTLTISMVALGIYKEISSKWKSLLLDGRLFVRRFFVAYCILSVTACMTSSTSNYIPIHLEKAGQFASKTISVHRKSGWLIDLRFKPPKNLTSSTDSRLVEYHNVIDDISGGWSTPLKPHRGLDLLLTIVQKKDDGSAFVKMKDEITEQHLSGAGDGAAWLYLYGLQLMPGEYVVTVQSLQDDPRLDGVDTELSVRKDAY